jgi:hypothetical protein
MNIATIGTKLATVGGPRAQLLVGKTAKYSPQILTAVGIAGGITSTVLIARATLKLEALVDHHELGRTVIKEKTDAGEYASDKERAKDVRYLYIHTVVDITKLYGPGVFLGAASIGSILAAQGIAQKRQVAMVAALSSAEQAFKAYRQRVIDAIGEEREADIRYGITTETIETGDGKKTKVKTFATTDGLPPYMAMYDSSNKNWEKGKRELNLLTLKNQQNWANDRLNARGYVYLNEVLAWLGLPTTPAGQVLGWLHKDLDNGDGYIDFGWDNPANRDNIRRFLDENNEEPGILLNFNIDGEINSKL